MSSATAWWNWWHKGKPHPELSAATFTSSSSSPPTQRLSFISCLPDDHALIVVVVSSAGLCGLRPPPPTDGALATPAHAQHCRFPHSTPRTPSPIRTGRCRPGRRRLDRRAPNSRHAPHHLSSRPRTRLQVARRRQRSFSAAGHGQWRAQVAISGQWTRLSLPGRERSVWRRQTGTGPVSLQFRARLSRPRPAHEYRCRFPNGHCQCTDILTLTGSV